MDQKGIENGPNMGQKWVRLGQQMEQKCFKIKHSNVVQNSRKMDKILKYAQQNLEKLRP